MHMAIEDPRIIYRALSGGAEYSYLVQVPESGEAWVGCRPRRVVSYMSGAFHVTERGRPASAPVASTTPLEDVRRFLTPGSPVFFLFSLDLQRATADESLPLILFIEPEVEVHVGGSAGSTPSVYAADAPEGAKVQTALARLSDRRIAAVPETVPTASAKGWNNEGDERFAERLESAISVLQQRPGQVAKMILMRTFERRVSKNLDPFRLYEIYTTLEPRSAASHYAQLGDGAASLGCSPENIFELNGVEITFDVIAGTRGVATDPEKDKRWAEELLNDPKEIREHDMALGRYRKRLEQICDPKTIRMDKHHGVRQLRTVRHILSRLTGRLRDKKDFLALIAESYPPLASYPKELIPLSDPMDFPTRYYGGVVGHAEHGWERARCYCNLRAMLLKPGIVHTIGGVGVIAESVPHLESKEVHNKLRAVLESVALWEQEGA
jgi:anthranilate/para-aminobenzoate synthase component I